MQDTSDHEARDRARRYRLLACVILVALTVPRMTQRGMFIDGIVWASVARNLSLGIGGLWAPNYTATAYTTFYEHPPLGFGLESIAFRVLGDHPAVERVYSLIVFALSAATITAIWRRFLPARYDWLPLFFWVMPSIVTWAVINNMLENTQALFTCAAIYALVRACGMRTPRATALCAIAAGGAIVAAVLVKGPVGFFPLAVPVLLFLLPEAQRPRQPATLWLTLIATVAVVFLAILAFDGPRHGLNAYLQTQLLPSLAGRREINTSASGVIYRLSTGIVARMGVVVALLYLVRRRSTATDGSPRVGWMFLATALIASVPLILSPRLSDHYFVPSVAFFALAAGAFALPFVRTFGDLPSRSWTRHLPAAFTAILAAATVAVPLVHGPIEPRGRDLLRDIDALAGALPPGAVVGACRASELEWGLRGYLQRFMRVSFDAADAPVSGSFLVYRGECDAPSECARIAGDPDLILYRCAAARGISR